MPTNRQLYRRSRRVRHRTRRPRRQRRTYTLTELLDRQPKTLRRHRLFPQVLDSLRNSPELSRVRLSKRAFDHLHNATIPPTEVEAFCRNYGLPRHPLFPAFLTAKRDYLSERERLRAARKHYILTRTRTLPEPVVACIKYLGHLENHYNRKDEHPLWSTRLFPSTKKQVHDYEGYSAVQWIQRFREHLERLVSRYPALTPVVVERIVACFILECLPDEVPPKRPPARTVNQRYRVLCLRHHPDHGGDAAVFIELKAARDLLLG